MRIISQKTCGSLFLISKNSEKGADMEEIMKYPDYSSLSYTVMASMWDIQCLLILKLEASSCLLFLLASPWVFNFGSLEFSFALQETLWIFRLGWSHVLALSIRFVDYLVADGSTVVHEALFWFIRGSLSVSSILCSCFKFKVLRVRFDELGAVRTIQMGSSIDRRCCSRCRCRWRWTWEEYMWRLFDAVNSNRPHNHTGSSGEPSLVNMYQTKA